MANGSTGPVPIRPTVSSADDAIARRTRVYKSWSWFATIGVFVACLILGARLSDASILIAALGLMSASLLGVFTQLAAWRSRLSERAARFVYTEEFDRSRVDRSVSLTLKSSVVALGAAVVLAGSAVDFDLPSWLQSFIVSQSWLDWVRSGVFTAGLSSFLTSTALACLAWIFVTVTYITVELGDSYKRISVAEENEARAVKANRAHLRDRDAG